MRFPQVILSILPLAITCLALPTASFGTLAPRQGLPAVIVPSPPNSQPAGSTLVQVGFDLALNYDFVASNNQAAAQIFTLLPQGIAYGLSIATSSVVMESLRPLDTTASLGYTTTLARFWIPSGEASEFQTGIRIRSSPFYSNPNANVEATPTPEPTGNAVLGAVVMIGGKTYTVLDRGSSLVIPALGITLTEGGSASVVAGTVLSDAGTRIVVAGSTQSFSTMSLGGNDNDGGNGDKANVPQPPATSKKGAAARVGGGSLMAWWVGISVGIGALAVGL